MDYRYCTDRVLLHSLIGRTATRRWYRGTLRSLFAIAGDTEEIAPLLVARELVQRMLCEELKTGDMLSSPDAVRKYLSLAFSGREYESFLVLLVDVKNQLISADELFRGTLTQTSVYPREVVKLALKHNAASVLLAHNHPSGNAEPSLADIHLTEQLRQALSLVDVHVLDHLVVAGTMTTSFAERGLL